MSTTRPIKRRMATLGLLLLVLLLIFSACGREGTPISATEEAQIEAVVQDYYVQDASVPAQEVTVEAVQDDWARVSIQAAATESENENMIVFLQRQTGSSAQAVPTAEEAAEEGSVVEAQQQSGWAIVLGPQATFTDEELDAAQIPADIRP